MTIEGQSPAPTVAAKRPWARLGALALVIVALMAVGHFTGATAWFDREHIRVALSQAGAWGYLIFFALFAIGELLHVPGLVFVAAAILAYGRGVGGALAYSGALVSLSVSFAVVRGLGGKALDAIERPFVRSMLARLDTYPVATIAALRAILWMAPPLNYALALSRVSFVQYIVGSAIGLLPPIALMAMLFDWWIG